MKKIKIQDYFEDNVETKRKLRKRINTLELELDTLKEIIKSELYKEFMSKLEEPQEMKRLKSENKELRLQVRELKKMLKEDKNE